MQDIQPITVAMASVYMEELEGLQPGMLDSLGQVDSAANAVGAEALPEGVSTLTACSRLIMRFETALRCAVEALDQGSRFVTVAYVPSRSLDCVDTLKIGGSMQRVSESTKEQLRRLVQLVDWLGAYKGALRSATEQSSAHRLERIDQLRDEAIRAHSTRESGSDDARNSDTRTVDIAAASTKGQLLGQTKKLTSSLMKGNQMLQAGILQSDLNLDELKMQTGLLQTVDDKNTQFQSVMQRTSTLVKTLERASNREKRDVYLALFFLVACMAWVFWRRILRAPTRLLLWLCFRFFKSILAAIGLVRAVAPATTPHSASPSAAATAALEQAVDAAMDRVLAAHDEL